MARSDATELEAHYGRDWAIWQWTSIPKNIFAPEDNFLTKTV